MADTFEEIHRELMLAKADFGEDEDGVWFHLKEAYTHALDIPQFIERQDDEAAPDVVRLRESLQGALVCSPEERGYFINQALDAVNDFLDDETVLETELTELVADVVEQHDREAGLETTNTATAPERPPDCVDWIDEDWGVLQLELTRPMLEWLMLEADDRGFDDEAHYTRVMLQLQLQGDLRKRHGTLDEVVFDVTEDWAQRFVCMLADMRQRDMNHDPRLQAFDHLYYDASFTLEGEPWDIIPDDETDGEDDGE